MRLVDELLEDEQLVDTLYEAQGESHPQSRIRGRMQTPSEVVLRLLLLKHIRNWSYDVLEREVRANLVCAFGRIRGEKVPDAKTLALLRQSKYTIAPFLQVKNRFLLKYANWNATS